MRIRFAIFAGAALVFSCCAAAQEKQLQDPAESKERNTQAYIQLLRSDLQASKRTLIKESMQLDEKQPAAFWPLYNQYDVEQTKLGDQKLALIQDYSRDFLTMTDEKADQLARRALELDDQRQALRKKYYDLFKTALPTVLVAAFSRSRIRFSWWWISKSPRTCPSLRKLLLNSDLLRRKLRREFKGSAPTTEAAALA